MATTSKTLGIIAAGLTLALAGTAWALDASTTKFLTDAIRGNLAEAKMGQLAQKHWGYSYRLLPNDPKVIAQQLSAGRPLLAEVRTHGLGNTHYPGYASHYEQTGWSVPHFVLIIGYDSTGVWLNDPGISWGRGYHISYAQLTHAIDDLDQHHPTLSEGQVLLLVAPEAAPKVKPGMI